MLVITDFDCIFRSHFGSEGAGDGAPRPAAAGMRAGEHGRARPGRPASAAPRDLRSGDHGTVPWAHNKK